MRHLFFTVVLSSVCTLLGGISSCDDPDTDGDGWTVDDGDCDDTNADVHPGAAEECDGVDQNCDGVSDAGTVGVQEYCYATIQAAIDAANDGDTVSVSPGTYLEHDLDFGGKALTLISTEGAEVTTIDAQFLGRVMSFTSYTEDGVVDGFTLTNGQSGNGGLVWIEGYADPTFRNVTFTNSTTTTGGDGGCVYTEFTRAAFQNSIFTWCVANGDGGAIYAGEHAELTVTNSLFDENFVTYNGAGIHVNQDADVEVTGCAFNSNVGYYGMGISFGAYSSGMVTNSSFVENYAVAGGGGVYVGQNAVVELTDLTINSNGADLWGGGLYIDHASPTLTRVIVTENSAGESGGGIYLRNAEPLMTDCVVEDNEPDDIARY